MLSLLSESKNPEFPLNHNILTQSFRLTHFLKWSPGISGASAGSGDSSLPLLLFHPPVEALLRSGPSLGDVLLCSCLFLPLVLYLYSNSFLSKSPALMGIKPLPALVFTSISIRSASCINSHLLYLRTSF